jgi:hypothetical protein
MMGIAIMAEDIACNARRNPVVANSELVSNASAVALVEA